MVLQEHLDILKQGVEYWNEWRREHQEEQPDLRGAELRNTNLSEANLSKSDLIGTDLSKSDLRRTNLSSADLRGASLSSADLSEANLSRAYLIRAYLIGTNLRRVTLFAADLSEADLRNANLSEADLREAILSEADISSADLSEADLSRTSLSRANLSGTILRGAILSEVFLSGTIFAENDLRTVKGLVEIDHRGPSRVELYTVKLPQDGSALHFLRGTGVPDEWIDVYRAQTLFPIQYHSCFISYSSKDDAIARRLHTDLQNHSVRCWFAPEDLKIGDNIRTHIDEAIHLQDKLLLLLSEHALASTWVEDEVEAALEKERRQQREVLFPVRLDESVMQTGAAWAASLRRTRHIGDFTRWKEPQAYQRAFERLLRDLKADAQQ